MTITQTSLIESRTRIQNFLDKFCIPDAKTIDDDTHAILMKAHFYYIDYQQQGWYVADDPDDFHRDLEDGEWAVYGDLWQKAIAYE